MHPRRVGHVLVHHLHHRQPRHRRPQPQLRTDMHLQRTTRGLLFQRHRPASKPHRIVPPQHQVGIRHRRPRPPPPITRRPRHRPGTLRPHPDPPQTIDLRQRPPTGPDLHHLDHRNPQRQPRPPAKPPHPRHLETARRLRPEIIDQTDLRRRPPHIKRQDRTQPALPRHIRRKNRPARRPALHQPDRKPARRLDRRQPTARQHQEHRSVHPDPFQRLRQSRQVTGHQRLHIRIRRRRRKPLPLAHFRRHLARNRHRHPRQRRRQNLPRPPLMRPVHETMQEPNGNTLNRLALQHRDQRPHRRLVQRQQNPPGIVQPLRHRQPQMPRHQRLRQHDIQVVLVVPALIAHRQHIAKSLRRHQRRPRALTLDDRIGRQRRAVDHDGNIARRQPARRQHRPHPLHHPLFRRRRRGEHLDRRPPPVMFQRKVGESAADINGQTGSRVRASASRSHEQRDPLSAFAPLNRHAATLARARRHKKSDGKR